MQLASGPSVSVYSTSRSFEVEGEHLPQLPVVISTETGVVPEIWYYCFIGAERGKSKGTIEGEVYILCRWLDFLQQQGLCFEDVNDRLLLAWKKSELKRVSKARVARQLDVIFDFYVSLQQDDHFSGILPEAVPSGP